MQIRLKTIAATIFILIFVLIFLNSTAFSRPSDYIEVAPQPLAIAITTKYQYPGLTVEELGEKRIAFESNDILVNQAYQPIKEISTFGAVSRSFKLGNAELLKFAVAPGGPLEQYGNSIAGWSIVMRVEGGWWPNFLGGKEGIFATKKINGETVEVQIGLQTNTDYTSPAFTARYSDMTTIEYKTITNNNNEEIQEIRTNSKSGSGTNESTIQLNLSFPADIKAFGTGQSQSQISTTLVGALFRPYREQQIYQRFRDESNQIRIDKSQAYLFFIPGAGTISGILGSAESETEFGKIMLNFSGSIRISPAKAKIVLGEI